MALDILELRQFYTTPLGFMARRLLLGQMRRLWPSVIGQTVCGLGYAAPFLHSMRGQALRTLLFMPASLGVMRWPSNGDNLAALVDEYTLPLPDSSVDRMIIVHTLEDVASPHDVMNEVWRVLSPNGRVLVVVPNRSGAWAQKDSTPFGQGRPYSKSQILDLLKDTGFSLNTWRESLFLPPTKLRCVLRAARTLEKMGQIIPSPFAGVYIAEGVKQVYNPIAVRRPVLVRLRPQFIPEFQPSGAVLRHCEAARSANEAIQSP